MFSSKLPAVASIASTVILGACQTVNPERAALPRTEPARAELPQNFQQILARNLHNQIGREIIGPVELTPVSYGAGLIGNSFSTCIRYRGRVPTFGARMIFGRNAEQYASDSMYEERVVHRYVQGTSQGSFTNGNVTRANWRIRFGENSACDSKTDYAPFPEIDRLREAKAG